MKERMGWSWLGPMLTLVGLLVVITSCPALSRPGAASRPIADTIWMAPPYDSLAAPVRREVDRYSGRDEYESARLDPGFEIRRWLYRSDSLTVVAFASRMRANTGPGLPAIVYCRGSFVAQGQAPMFVPLFHRLASAGYVVVAPQYRGSEGGEGRDELGGADLEDVMAAVRLAAHTPGVDAHAVYLYGESRGGMMTLQALRDRAPVRAAATVGAFTDLDTMMRDDPRSRSMADKIWPDFAEHGATITARRSALRWADQLHVPLLILHGREDGQVRPWHGERLAAALTARRTPCELHVMDGAGHTLGERSRERDSLVVDWFRRHQP